MASAHLSKWYTNQADDNSHAVCLESECGWAAFLVTCDDATELALEHAEENDHLTAVERPQWRLVTPSCYVSIARQEKVPSSSVKGG